jgi:hypothetical protein
VAIRRGDLSSKIVFLTDPAIELSEISSQKKWAAVSNAKGILIFFTNINPGSDQIL